MSKLISLPDRLLPSIYLGPNEVFSYSPHSEVILWLKPLWSTRVAGTLFLLFILFNIGINTGWIDYLSKPLIAFYSACLVPFKYLINHALSGSHNPIVAQMTRLAPMINLSIACAGIALAYHLGRLPSRVAITPSGIYVISGVASYDLTVGGQPTQFFYNKMLHWSDVEQISLLKPSGKKSNKDYVLCFKARRNDLHTLKLRLGDLYVPEERERFLRDMRLFAPAGAIDEESMAAIEPPRANESFTELWLKELSGAPKRERLRPLTPGTILKNNSYEIVEKLGMGGQATVYLASTLSGRTPDQATDALGSATDALRSATKNEVAIKECILPIFPDMAARRKSVQSFENEAQILRRLEHPKIVRLVDVFVEDHRAYIVLEKAPGLSLKKLVQQQGRQDEAFVVAVGLELAEIFEYLHGQEPPMIHRDISPDNLIIGPNNELKLIDFSVAQEIRNNITGTIVGKHNYIAPEQFRGMPNEQSDIYSIGCVLYHLLTAEDPEPITTSCPSEKYAGISDNMNAIVAKATALDQSMRYANIAELRVDLEKLRGKRLVIELPNKADQNA